MSEERQRVFFLGGRDLEMLTIRELLEETATPFFDRDLPWGAKASAYAEEIHAALERGQVPVLVELDADLELDPERVVRIDHHGDRAGRGHPTSLEQVFTLLELPQERWTRRLELVAANDRGGIEGLLATGATSHELAEIRAEDRAAQAVSPEDEEEATAAVDHLEHHARGRLTVAHLPHASTAPLADRLHPELGGPGFENLLVLSPTEVNFYGSGELIRALDDRYPGGWSGGELPERGFWGHSRPVEGVVEFLVGKLEQTSSPSD